MSNHILGRSYPGSIQLQTMKYQSYLNVDSYIIDYVKEKKNALWNLTNTQLLVTSDHFSPLICPSETKVGYPAQDHRVLVA